MFKIILLAILATLVTSNSIAQNSAQTKQGCTYDPGCDCTPIICDIPVQLIQIVHLFVEEGISKYGEKNLCDIAQYVKEYIELYEGTKGWVVLIGSNNLMGTPFDFASALNHQKGTYLRYLHKHKLSVELFRPTPGDEPVDKSTDVPKINPGALTRVMDTDTQLTDADFIRQIKLKAVIDPILDCGRCTFQESADSILKAVEGVCEGQFIVWVARKNMLSQTYNSCAKYQHYTGSRYVGQYKRSDSEEYTIEVVLFAPKKIN